ncbi:MAG: hypothetical protein Q4G27_05600 [Flavobacteriaceae bacterium]|nr:hypothetical protein [Flavobacteriaceae bacterium]
MKYLSLIFVFILSGIVYGQSRIYFSDNVKAPLTTKERAQIEEVYGRGATFVMERPSLLRNIKDLLRNRIEVMEIPLEKARGSDELMNATDLSTTALYTAYNPNLTRDLVYSANFNILKYQINPYPVKREIYKLGNYYISILPQNRTEK